MIDDLSTDSVTDEALFNSVVTGTAPEPTPAPPAPEQAATPPAPAPDPTPAQPAATPAATPQAAEPSVPPSRLREEAERARIAERERDELRAQLARLQGQAPQAPAQPAPTEQPKPKDFWENPDEFTQHQVREALTPVETMVREFIFTQSRDRILGQEGGEQKLQAAETALREAVQRGEINPDALKADLGKSMDPAGDVLRWHQRRTALQTVGTDPNAWLNAEIEKRMADPAFQAEVVKRAQATANGNPAVVQSVNQNAAPAIPPSVSSIGQAAASSSGPQAVSDSELFTKTTSRRR